LQTLKQDLNHQSSNHQNNKNRKYSLRIICKKKSKKNYNLLICFDKEDNFLEANFFFIKPFFTALDNEELTKLKDLSKFSDSLEESLEDKSDLKLLILFFTTFINGLLTEFLFSDCLDLFAADL
tara:strand:+ start:1877 stop:2248 length:372 start_codon:yes stop_codon:yes gene_type:complete